MTQEKSSSSSSSSSLLTFKKNCVVLDCGGFTCKAGYAHQEEPIVIPNVIAKQKSSSTFYIGDQFEKECQNYSGLVMRRPHDKGYIVDAEAQASIWKRIFGSHVLNVKQCCGGFQDTSLVISHPPFQPRTLQKDINEIAFEFFGFESLSSVPSSLLCLYSFFHKPLSRPLVSSSSSVNEINEAEKVQHGYNDPNDEAIIKRIMDTKSALIIDSGFSFSHAVPIVNNEVKLDGIRRVNIGGKLLTNYLKETVSMRAYDVTEEVHLMNIIKEKLCYVSMNFLDDLKKTRMQYPKNDIIKRYVLPDYVTSKVGHVKEAGESVTADEQILVMNNERISVPELLFNPSDVGMNQAGVGESAVQCVESFKGDDTKQLLYDSVVLVGGNSLFPNYKSRMYSEMRPLVETVFDLSVLQTKNPITTCWKGGAAFSNVPEQLGIEKDDYFISRHEFQEYGQNMAMKRFKIQ